MQFILTFRFIHGDNFCLYPVVLVWLFERNVKIVPDWRKIQAKPNLLGALLMK